MIKKDGEIKVFIQKNDDAKTAEKKEAVQYTVDDLVKDSKLTESEDKEKCS